MSDLKLTDQELADIEARRKANAETVIDEDGGVAVEVEETKSTEVAKVAEWPHMTIKYADAEWQVRKPSEQALAAFSLSSGKYIPAKMQNDMVGLFIKQHMSETSHETVYVRLMDPDDPEFDAETLGDLMRIIATLRPEDDINYSKE